MAAKVSVMLIKFALSQANELLSINDLSIKKT